jgi:hypothetical protein
VLFENAARDLDEECGGDDSNTMSTRACATQSTIDEFSVS